MTGGNVRVVSAAAMREADRRAIEGFGIPAVVLMENAARAVADEVIRRYPGARRVALVCGPGNNGGDGLAAARHLAARERAVTVIVAGADPQRYAGAAAVNWRIAAALGLEVHHAGAGGTWRREIEQADVIVDALFGSGLSRPIDGDVAGIVAFMNASGTPIVAVDVPSGLGESVAAEAPHVRSSVTVALAALERVHLFHQAAEACGELVVADIGIPEAAFEGLEQVVVLGAQHVARLLPPRPAAAHKGQFGHLLVVAGARGTAGAAVLAARGAVRAGAGLVTVAVPDAIAAIVDGGSLESMTVALPATASGALAAPARAVLEALLEGKDAVAVGPGLGRHPETVELVRWLTGAVPVALVLDADGINAWAGAAAGLTARLGPTVLTPHPGELARLLGTTTAAVAEDRLAAAADAVRSTGATVVLKGRHTLIASPGESTQVCPTGNSGMATGGSGDVLTGVMGALLAQRLAPAEAAAAAAYVHGLAGDIAARRRGGRGLAAADIAEELPAAFVELGHV